MHKGNLPLTTSAMGKVSFTQSINHIVYSRKIKLQNHLQDLLWYHWEQLFSTIWQRSYFICLIGHKRERALWYIIQLKMLKILPCIITFFKWSTHFKSSLNITYSFIHFCFINIQQSHSPIWLSQLLLTLALWQWLDTELWNHMAPGKLHNRYILSSLKFWSSFLRDWYYYYF